MTSIKHCADVTFTSEIKRIPTVTMLVGLPASGKSTWAEENKERLNAEIFSSDSLRKELYGDESIQSDNIKLFTILHKRIKDALLRGENVIYDATNISEKRRRAFNQEFKKFNREVVYFNTSFLDCVIRDEHRKRTVSRNIIKKMFKTLQVPTYSEGWNEIYIVDDSFSLSFIDKARDLYEKDLINASSHDELMEFMHVFIDLAEIYNLPHDNPHHTFGVSLHTYYVYKYVKENYKPDDKVDSHRDFLKMLWTALIHDVGKGYTKVFANHKGEPTRYAHFYGHENASAQIAVNILSSLKYDMDFILDVAELVQNHMKLLNGGEKKLKKNVSEDVFNKLMFFKEADESAK